jgi:sigma-B regulation protein RsbU (phosphoserine phosphatase)
MLQAHGYAVASAGDPERACRLLGREPDAVLLDGALAAAGPAWEGFLRECQLSGIPCLVLGQASEDPGGRHAAWAEGLLPCSLEEKELLGRIAGSVRIRQLQQELTKARDALRQRLREQEEDLRSAAQIQQSLLPLRMPVVDNFRFAGRVLPFERIGGDLYNVLQLDEETVMAYLFDVSGHGVSSAMVTVSVYQSLSLQTGRIVKRVLVAPPYYKILSPAEVLTELDREYRFDRFEKFFTITYLLLDLVRGTVRFSSAGHPPSILVRSQGGHELLRAEGGLIGLGIGGPFAEGEVVLAAGDRLFLYSDGITEFFDTAGEAFGEERLFRLFDRFRGHSLEATCDGVLEALRHFGAGTPLQDDVTLLGIEFLGG